MKPSSFSRASLGLAAGALLLTACGGSGGGSDLADPLASGTDVPLSATASADGALGFVKSVAATTSDSTEPIVVGEVVLGSSETDEPDPSI